MNEVVHYRPWSRTIDQNLCDGTVNGEGTPEPSDATCLDCLERMWH